MARERDFSPPEPPTAVCPECGETLGWQDEIFTTARTDHVVGCTRCLDKHDAGYWFMDTYDDYNGPDTIWEAG